MIWYTIMHSKSLLTAIRIVLVNTTHPGNIGAVARAMKNMGLSQLCLVNPKLFPHAEATARASGADDLLKHATVVNDLDAAIKDCDLVIGSSVRMRGIPWPVFDVREAAAKIIQEAPTAKIAILFGQEKSGLTNEELQRCHFVINIPSNPDYSSLNLAAAAQIVAYEIWMAQSTQPQYVALEKKVELATADETQKFYAHLEQTLMEINFLDPHYPKQLMRRLTRLFNRLRMEKREVNILRGILTAVQEKFKGKN